MASTSNSEFKCSYDIFLSFRGLDTRNKFTDHLYEALKREGFETFRDNEGIERGENINSELQKAIWNSSMSVIVLSKTYATSKSCLFEIQTILEHRKKSDHVIFPVFYEVEPWEIKEQSKNLDFRGKKVTDEEVKGWSAALKEVASMAGMDLDENMQNLKSKVGYLSGQADDINSQISNAERWPGKRPKKEVEVWLTNVQQFKDDVQRLEQKIVGETTNVSSCMQLGKDIAKKILEVQELQKKGSDFKSLMVDEDTTGRLLQPLTEYFVECTKARNTENIWECLMNDDVTKIGVYGMGGIGKTTTMKYIQNRLLKEKDKFDYVYWVTVSKAFDITKLQSDIANAMNLGNCLNDKDETKRALELHKMLDRQKRYILILDDVWDQFDLDSVGIPVPKRSNGWKLVLTTRSLEVCERMKCTPVKVDLLTEEEALTLFRNIVVGNESVLAPDVEEIAAKIAKECACLPLAIVTLAGSLRGSKGTHKWRNALNELISLTRDASDDVSKVFERLKFSYSLLGNKVLQDCFLYCSLYPEDHDIPVNELIEYWIAEELIGDMDSVEAQLDKGLTILGKLTSSCLLEKTYNYRQECVRMHDLIRDMAIRITATSSPRFLVKAGVTKKWVPYEPWSDDLERISFMYSSIIDFPIAPPVCPRLTTLLLNAIYSCPLGVIPDSFFSNMPCLKVLNLSNRYITSLPESISNLENLHALVLRSCEELKYVPSLEKLKALKTFVLTGSKIEELPEGIEELVNLIKLDLSYNQILRTFPTYKLRRLSKLQYLRIGGTGVEVSTEGLLCLRQLKVVAVHLHNVQELNRYVISQQFQGLQEYCLIVGERDPELIGYEGKQFNINYKPVPFERVDQLVLPAGLESFTVDGFYESFAVDGFHDPISLSAIPGFKDAKVLRECRVICCKGLESIFSSSTFSDDGQIPLGTVEFFRLVGLPRLRVLFDGIAPPHNIYFNLKDLQIIGCDAMKNIFPVQLLQNLPNLESLEVKVCKNVEDIIIEIAEMSDRGNHQDYSNSISLPKLKFLGLD
ncbi:hypothetical protein RHGRI_032484 [Rhododendron griersonianum]|uniref:TIR domain-containing protein n=1 Tax=Rhododendron griersonianum TaxID=479676 RepID=A0AAV6IEG3_9ERIC|nr:hypothetical protein RHGRI_032484 [Rhododendron griersonianum]